MITPVPPLYEPGLSGNELPAGHRLTPMPKLLSDIGAIAAKAAPKVCSGMVLSVNPGVTPFNDV